MDILELAFDRFSYYPPHALRTGWYPILAMSYSGDILFGGGRK